MEGKSWVGAYSTQRRSDRFAAATRERLISIKFLMRTHPEAGPQSPIPRTHHHTSYLEGNLTRAAAISLRKNKTIKGKSCAIITASGQPIIAASATGRLPCPTWRGKEIRPYALAPQD